MKIVIIGGGIMGLSIATELRRDAGLEVVVLEKSIPGAEASSAAAGMLAPQFESEKPGPLLDLCLLSRMAWPKFARELEDLSGVAVHYLPSGGLQVAFTDDEAHALQAKVDWQTASGLRAAFLSQQELRGLEPAINDEALAAAHFPDDHQVDPRRLMRALAVAASKRGVEFRTGTVRGLVEREGRVVGVDVDDATLEGDVVVLAAGAWSGLVSGARVDPSRVKPVRGQMLELQVRAPRFTRLLKGASGYLVPRSDGAIIAGSTMEMAGYEKHVTVEGLTKLLRSTLELVPSLAAAPINQTWAGLRPWTDDQLPFLGEGPREGLLLATGHFRNGILLAPITARLIGQLVRREKPTLELRPFRYERNSP